MSLDLSAALRHCTPPPWRSASCITECRWSQWNAPSSVGMPVREWAVVALHGISHRSTSKHRHVANCSSRVLQSSSNRPAAPAINSLSSECSGHPLHQGWSFKTTTLASQTTKHAPVAPAPAPLTHRWRKALASSLAVVALPSAFLRMLRRNHDVDSCSRGFRASVESPEGLLQCDCFASDCLAHQSK